MQTAVITGASTGIGKAICERLINTGKWQICMIARSKRKMEEILTNIKQPANESVHKIICVDLSSQPDAVDVCSQIDAWCNHKLDLLINNAGNLGSGSVKSASLKQWNYTFNVHVTSAFIFTQKLFQSLKNAQGNIINIGSIYGPNLTVPSSTPYCVSKSAMLCLTKLSALEYAEDKVRVNCIQPGFIPTNILKTSGEFTDEELTQFYQIKIPSITPLQRSGTTKDIVDLVMFVGDSDNASWITGQILTIDGGVSLVNAMYPGSKL